jgi:HPr serine kinase-like protein
VDARLATEGELDELWPALDGERIVERSYPNGAVHTAIDMHPALGYRIFAEGYGRFAITSRATRILCAPEATDAWRWQRYLIGQVLPITSVLHGHEVLHASAVSVEGRALGFVAGSGVGKSSLALSMMLRGHLLVADDVVALSLRDGVPHAEPGPAVTSLRAAESRRLGTERDRLGRLVGRDEGSLRIAVRREHRSLPLGALYLLERSGDLAKLTFERVEPDFRLLVENGFDFLVSTQARMRNQLVTLAAVARNVPCFRVWIPPDVHASDLATSVEEHAVTGEVLA